MKHENTSKTGIKSVVWNMDNMDFMRGIPDKFYDLAIVDPPYGLGERLVNGGKGGLMGTMRNLADNKVKIWDDKIPESKYFTELKRISKNQIIWGANYFLDYLGKTDGFIVWDKMNGTNPMSDAELAWQNIKKSTRIFRWHHFSGERKIKIHPTQKPVKLYEWILNNYAKEGDKILDTHLGSGSSRIACHNLWFDFTSIELDSEYFNASVKRFENHIKQLTLF